MMLFWEFACEFSCELFWLSWDEIAGSVVTVFCFLSSSNRAASFTFLLAVCEHSSFLHLY